MFFGQLLFVLAALTIAAGTLLGIVIGVSRLISYKILGLDTGPQPTPGSAEWMANAVSAATVDTAKRSLLTERRGGSAQEPLVDLAGARYRVTRLGGSRYLVTLVDEGRRVGMFELDGSGRHQAVLPEPDEPSQATVITQVALLASLEHTHVA